MGRTHRLHPHDQNDALPYDFFSQSGVFSPPLLDAPRVKTLRNKNVCNTVHIPTKDNLADIFTKILPSGDFIRLRDQLLHPTHTN